MTSTEAAAAIHEDFPRRLRETGREPLRARTVATLQVNVGKLCNQVCKHCHVDAGPHRDRPEENMQRDVAELVVEVLRRGGIETLDLTGGAPELNPNFRWLVRAATDLGVHVIDRCNLTVLFAPGQEDLAEFLASHDVEIVASLPYFARARTDAQRGPGVFDASLAALRRLNALGYGRGDPRHRLNLVYNPAGAYLPAPQDELEAEYRARLREHGVEFDRLYALCNLPIHRFLDYLRRSGNEARYRRRLYDAFNPLAADEVMCRDLISVGPDGTLYDCDFNQMLGLGVAEGPRHLRDFAVDRLRNRRIAVGGHCFGCTAGAGSSCGGATVQSGDCPDPRSTTESA